MIILVLGGVRSGKSEVAETLAGRGRVTYVATAGPPGEDTDFAVRIEEHRRRRPAQWQTVEAPYDLAGALVAATGTVVVDALGMWVAHAMGTAAGRPDIDALVAALRGRDGDVVIVSEEVGLGVHPATASGRRFADLLGEVNRRVAEVADRCLLVVAGRVVELPTGTAAAAGTGSFAPPPLPGVPSAPSDVPSHGDSPGRGAGPAGAVDGLRSAVAFLTVFGGSAPPSPATLGWLPLVGAVVGLVLGLAWAGLDELFGPFAGAALIVAVDLALTGALHFDGLVDTTDGLLPHLPRDRRLAVMAEPDVGAFGVAAGASVLLLRAAALTTISVGGGPNPLLLAALWWCSRASMTVAAAALPYARPGGLATAFAGIAGRDTPARLAAAASIVVIAAGLGGVSPASVVALPAAAAGAAAVHLLARRRLGGYTGDVLGAGGVIAETVGLLTAAALA